MGFLDWIKGLIGRSRRRDVRALGDEDADFSQEVIDTSGGPLKENHLRRALRDKRLLPKRTNLRLTGKKRRILPNDEARRLFSSTLRTNNRQIRDLTTDAQQLARYELPVWNNEKDVAKALGLTVKQLQHFSIHRERETCVHYVCFAIPKRSGGERLIHAPKSRLKRIQRQLNELLVRKLPVSPHAHGFLRRRSVATNASPHCGKEVVIKLDLRDFFPSIHFGRVRGLLIAMGYGYPVATTLAVLMTEPPRQPVVVDKKTYYVPTGPRVCVQGAPTSPGICNAILSRMDRRLAGLAKKHGFDYTRYADDLTLSGDATKAKMILTVSQRIVREEGLQINKGKTRILRKAQRQMVTGVVVNESAGLSRRDRRRIRAEIHQLSKAQNPDSTRIARLTGKLAYLQMLNPQQAEPLQRALNEAL